MTRIPMKLHPPSSSSSSAAAAEDFMSFHLVASHLAKLTGATIGAALRSDDAGGPGSLLGGEGGLGDFMADLDHILWRSSTCGIMWHIWILPSLPSVQE